MNINYCVYMHVSPNGKKYIGMTQNYLKRWRNGLGYRNNKYFYNAIQKYGWDNFEHIIVAEKLSQHDAEIIEIELISKYKSNQKEYGYNHAKGGKINSGYRLSKETRQKLSESHKGLSYNKGKSLSEEHKNKISNGMKKHYTSNQCVSPMKGKQHSDETRKKMSESHKGKHVGKNNFMFGKKLSDEHKKKISTSLSGRTLSESHKRHLSNAAKGKTFSEKHIDNLIDGHRNQYVKIIQKSSDGEIIKIWNSIAFAARELKIDRRYISNCLSKNKKCKSGKYKTHGYIFEYYDESDNYA